MFVRTLNADVQKNVSPYITLERGAGYYYFVYDDGSLFETHSVMVTRLCQLSRDQWIEETRKLLERVERLRTCRGTLFNRTSLNWKGTNNVNALQHHRESLAHVQLIDFAPLYRRLSTAKVLAAKPELIGTVLGVQFYEHPTRGDEVGMIAIDLNGQAYQTDWYDLPRDEDLIDHIER